MPVCPLKFRQSCLISARHREQNKIKRGWGGAEVGRRRVGAARVRDRKQELNKFKDRSSLLSSAYV